MLVLPGGYIILSKFLVTKKPPKPQQTSHSSSHRNTFWLLWPLCFWIWWVTQHPSIWNPLPWQGKGQRGMGMESPNLGAPFISWKSKGPTPSMAPSPGNRAYQVSTIIVPQKIPYFVGGNGSWGRGVALNPPWFMIWCPPKLPWFLTCVILSSSWWGFWFNFLKQIQWWLRFWGHCLSCVFFFFWGSA